MHYWMYWRFFHKERCWRWSILENYSCRCWGNLIPVQLFKFVHIECSYIDNIKIVENAPDTPNLPVSLDAPKTAEVAPILPGSASVPLSSSTASKYLCPSQSTSETVTCTDTCQKLKIADTIVTTVSKEEYTIRVHTHI